MLTFVSVEVVDVVDVVIVVNVVNVVLSLMLSWWLSGKLSAWMSSSWWSA